VPSNPDAGRVLITHDAVMQNVIPTIVPRDYSGRRHRRAPEEKSA
jgi:ATP-dependent Clp protease ATP-binding subunit ClpX